MKNIILIVLFFVTGVICFAQETQDFDTVEADTMENIDALIRSSLDRNFYAIQQEAAGLDEEERLEIYNQHKKDVWKGGLLNLIPFIGIGSGTQGDYLGMGIIITGQAIGGLIVVGSGLAVVMSVIMIFPMLSSEYGQFIQNVDTAIKVGGITIGVFYLFGIARGFCYPAAYNRKLETALRIGKTTLDVEPSVNITERGLEMAFSVKF
jgi:hypothetical protein